MKVLFAGGGTGGHIVPGRNLAQHFLLKVEGSEVRFLTAGRKVENRFFESRPWKRTALFSGYESRPSLRDLGSWWKAFRSARREIRSFRPQALILTGGYVSIPSLLAAGRLRKHTYLVELNAYPGRAARLCARFCRRIFCPFEEAGQRLGNKAFITGAPLPPGFATPPEECRETLRTSMGLDPHRMTLLVAGGSQGAMGINSLIVENLDLLARQGGENIQVLHVTGPRDHGRILERYRTTEVNAVVLPFLDPMEKAYRAADLILCRGGGMTLAEIAALALPAVVIPYPFHKDRHQFHNARNLVEAGGALILEEGEATEEMLRRTVLDPLMDPSRLGSMAEGMQKAGSRGGAGKIVEIILEDLEKMGKV